MSLEENWRAQKSEWFVSSVQLDLAVAYCRLGDFEHALTLLREVETAVEKRPEFEWTDILYRIKGEVLLAQAMKRSEAAAGNEVALQLEEAAAAFMQAIQLTRACQAKIRELQATMGLCQLWKHQGKIAVARSTLVVIYEWFTEGFDTAILVEAKALLDALTTAPSNADPHITS